MSVPSSGGASRDGYGKALLRLSNDPRVVESEAHSGKTTKSCHFPEKFPESTTSMGIATQNMMLLATGTESSEKDPFDSTIPSSTEKTLLHLSLFISLLCLQVLTS